jgi:hypothetical protein
MKKWILDFRPEMEGSMGESANKKGPTRVSVNLPGGQAVLEKIPSQESEHEKIHLFLAGQGQALFQPFELPEAELVLLLQKAIKAGILSPDFVKNLGAEFEI